jgi:hypothetical protein
LDVPLTERTNVHGGAQAMPLSSDNNRKFSEAMLTPTAGRESDQRDEHHNRLWHSRQYNRSGRHGPDVLRRHPPVSAGHSIGIETSLGLTEGRNCIISGLVPTDSVWARFIFTGGKVIPYESSRPLNTLTIKDSHKISAIRQEIDVHSRLMWAKSTFVVSF